MQDQGHVTAPQFEILCFFDIVGSRKYSVYTSCTACRTLVIHFEHGQIFAIVIVVLPSGVIHALDMLGVLLISHTNYIDVTASEVTMKSKWTILIFMKYCSAHLYFLHSYALVIFNQSHS